MLVSEPTLLLGDCLERMKEIPDGTVHTCVTSPPYFGLRDYGMDGQIGLEETPDAFVQRLVEVFREVRRTLRDDGTLWVNLGDSYARAGGWSNNNGLDGVKRSDGKRVKSNMTGTGGASQKLPAGMKQKDLIGVPWRFVFAMQLDGWYLRQDIIWHKPNPMPESCRDRCTKAHEYIFLFAKSSNYYFDHEAMKEGAVGVGVRNRRSVWSVPTRSFKGAYFATFPPDLIEPCILAGAPKGGVVLDPFGGSGTTAGVALKHGRKAILCELNPDYGDLVAARVRSIAGNLAPLEPSTIPSSAPMNDNDAVTAWELILRNAMKVA